MALHILADRCNVVGWWLMLNYVQTLPTHFYLESSGRATYMETHPNSNTKIFSTWRCLTPSWSCLTPTQISSIWNCLTHVQNSFKGCLALAHHSFLGCLTPNTIYSHAKYNKIRLVFLSCIINHQISSSKFINPSQMISID